MHASGGICDNYIPADYPYMAVYPWRGTLRPHHEPTKLRDTFSGATVSVNADEPLKYLEHDAQTITYASGLHRCGECRKSWWDAVRSFVCPGDVP